MGVAALLPLVEAKSVEPLSPFRTTNASKSSTSVVARPSRSSVTLLLFLREPEAFPEGKGEGDDESDPLARSGGEAPLTRPPPQLNHNPTSCGAEGPAYTDHHLMLMAVDLTDDAFSSS